MNVRAAKPWVLATFSLTPFLFWNHPVRLITGGHYERKFCSATRRRERRATMHPKVVGDLTTPVWRDESRSAWLQSWNELLKY